MINLKKILTITPTLICFSTVTFATNLSGADFNICSSYLNAIHNGTSLSDGQKTQANNALKKCLSNNPSACSNFPNSPNCTNIKSKIDLLGYAIPMPTPEPNVTLSPQPKSTQIEAITPTKPPQLVNPNHNAPQTYPTSPSNDTKSITQPTNQKNKQSEPYSYF